MNLSALDAVKLGSTDITKLMFGSTEVWSSDPITTEVVVTASETAEELTNASSSDPTLFPAGHNYTDSSDLDIPYDLSHSTIQTIGLKYSLPTIPQGAAIVSAVINFVSGAAHGTDTAEAIIHGESAVAPAAFVDDPDTVGSFNLSSRTKTTASVVWTNSNSLATATPFDSPDISSVLQEIVNLPGFVGDFVILIDSNNPASTGNKRASNTTKPQITVTYNTDGVISAPTSLVVTPGDTLNTLTWVDSVGLSGIRVYRSTTSGSGHTLIDTVAAGVETYEDTGLTNGTEYFYYLTAIDAGSNESAATTEESGIPVAPLEVAIVASSLTGTRYNNNATSRSHTHTTTKSSQDGNTALVWVVLNDGHADNPSYWASSEGLTLLGSLDGERYGDDIAVYIEFPSWSVSGTEFTRTFTTPYTNQATILCVEIENVDETTPLDALGDTVTDTNLTSANSELTTTTNGALAVAIFSSEYDVGRTQSITANPDSYTELYEDSVLVGDHPLVYIGTKQVAAAGLVTSPTLTVSTSDRITLLHLSIRPSS